MNHDDHTRATSPFDKKGIDTFYQFTLTGQCKCSIYEHCANDLPAGLDGHEVEKVEPQRWFEPCPIDGADSAIEFYAGPECWIVSDTTMEVRA